MIQKETNIVTRRRPYGIFYTIRVLYSLITYHANSMNKRRSTNVCPKETHRTNLAERHFKTLDGGLYNIVDKNVMHEVFIVLKNSGLILLNGDKIPVFYIIG